jgi:hypothetical protein
LLLVVGPVPAPGEAYCTIIGRLYLCQDPGCVGQRPLVQNDDIDVVRHILEERCWEILSGHRQITLTAEMNRAQADPV